ncbi:MAG TPA: Uma2 family endonuclease [Gemmataceae bacterium]|jgi:Uma2 family endonuclease|nr:Uma2 family endonuclease [Gemmataceae bacterium]
MSTASTRTKLVLGPEMNGIILTPEEFDAVEDYDENYRYELIHGVLVVSAIPLEASVGPNEMLGYCLLDYQQRHPQGSALNLTLPERYIRTRDSRRLADRVIWAGLGRLPNWKKEHPSIAVEFVSARRRDRERDYVDKRRDYMEIKIKEYWIIDRFRRTLTVIRYRPRRPEVLVINEKEVYTTPLLPGFELPLKKLLAVADMLDKPPE